MDRFVRKTKGKKYHLGTEGYQKITRRPKSSTTFKGLGVMMQIQSVSAPQGCRRFKES